MNEKQQTPLTKSIQRKVDRIKESRQTISDSLKGKTMVPAFSISRVIVALESEISEEKKLLPEERDEIVQFAFNVFDVIMTDWDVENRPKVRDHIKRYFDTHYTQEIQEG